MEDTPLAQAAPQLVAMSQSEKAMVPSRADDEEENFVDDAGRLARRLTRASSTMDQEIRAYNPELGSHLDPKSPTFNPREWFKALLRLYEADPLSAPDRFLGVAFRNLSAYGWSTSVESQPTVSSMVTSTLSSLAGLVGAKRWGKRTDNLRDFDGVVE
ncbi:hypothetical protein ACJ73_06253 [Blastomyces percursus]|uniref:Pleiotropic ABC efflux transporter N-terminal domain-containing protein n=1 Tax=Blastomyces percursus TaxID=1658174 RepID=A0A1J9Q2T4_9EURO|nr:hypothetical protein ACJ73_06253 [Blastomyces percursus]